MATSTFCQEMRKYENGAWTRQSSTLRDAIQGIQTDGLRLICFPLEQVDLEHAQRLMHDLYGFPMYLWSGVCDQINGFSGSNTVLKPSGAVSHNLWFRYLVKETRWEPGVQTQYQWYEMTILLHRVEGQNFVTAFAFNFPGVSGENIEKSLSSPGQAPSGEQFLLAILEEIIRITDIAVWRMSKLIRHLEKNRLRTGYLDSYTRDEVARHEVARHAIHITEVLEVGANTFENLVVRVAHFFLDKQQFGSNWRDKSPTLSVSSDVEFLHSISKALVARSRSNQARLTNENNLALNYAQLRESATMKTIAIATAAFLPATFVSTIFGMTFFNFQPGQSDWQVSPMFWIYWAITVPLTVLTVVIVWWDYMKRLPQTTKAQWEKMRKRSGSTAVVSGQGSSKV